MLSLCGCGSELTPVHGKVTYQGQQLSGAKVSFYAPDGRIATGITDGAGQFSLATGTELGVAPGRYRVTVTKYSQSTGASDPRETARMKKYQGGRVPGPPRSEIPEKYGDPDQSALEAEVTGDPARDTFAFTLD
jgi:hypothetical protein